MERSYFLPCALLILLTAWNLQAQTFPRTDEPLLRKGETALAGEAATFIENRGQWDRHARFLAQLDGLDLWVTDGGVLYDLHRIIPMETGRNALASGRPQDARRSGHVVRMEFLAAGAGAHAVGTGKAFGTVNYLTGSDRSRWIGNVPRYRATHIREIYPGIDAALYFDNGLPRYDLLLAPGADPNTIRVRYDGAENVSINSSGELVIATSLGEMTQRGLFAYQTINGEKVQVPCSFRIGREGQVGFQLGAYDRSRPLVIDPILASSFISPSAYSRGEAMAIDGSKNIYVTGYTGITNYPTTTGAYQRTYGAGTYDAFVSKLDSNAQTLLYSTYIGGSSDDAGMGIAVDPGGNIYVTGHTFSGDFPTRNALDGTLSQWSDIFVMKIDPFQPAPQDQLVYSTYVGGDGYDYGNDIYVKNGYAYVTGQSTSLDFPTINAYQASPALGAGSPAGDVVAFRLGLDGTVLLGSTYLGGERSDIGYGIAVDPIGNVYIAGQTYSPDFPIDGTSPGYSAAPGGQSDAFIAKLDGNLSTLIYSTYMGGSADDYASSIDIDAAGNAYITGRTASANYPATPSSFRPTRNGAVDAFVTKLSSAGNTLSYSGYLGGGNDDFGHDIRIDPQGNAYIVGVTRSDNFPSTANALQPLRKGGMDAFVAKVAVTGDHIAYATLLGGTDGDTASTVAVDAEGTIFLSGTTFSTNFPTTSGSYRPSGPGGIFVARIGVMQLIAPTGTEVWCSGEFADIRWEGASFADPYDLYLTADSGKTFSPIAFNITGGYYSWFIPVALAAGTNYRIRVIKSNGTEADLSRAFIIINRPVIRSHPQNVTLGVGATATFTTSATGTPTPTLRWQMNDGTGWKIIDGETSTTLKVTNVTESQNGYRYRAVFENECKLVASDSATLTVRSTPVITVDHPDGGESFCAGSTVTLRWSSANGSGIATLRLSSDGGSTWSPLANNLNGNTYDWTIPENLTGTAFRIQALLVGSAAEDLSDGNFTINKAPSITKDPTNVVSQFGENVSFSITANGTPAPGVQWEADTGTGWMAVPSGTSATLTMENIDIEQDGTKLRAIVTNDCGSDTSEIAILTVTFEGGVDDIDAGSRLLRLAIAPNPARSAIAVSYFIPRGGMTEIRIVDARGRIVARPLARQMDGGEHTLNIDVTGLPAGTYSCVLVSGTMRRTVRMAVVR